MRSRKSKKFPYDQYVIISEDYGYGCACIRGDVNTKAKKSLKYTVPKYSHLSAVKSDKKSPPSLNI
ncbi:DUF4087 domain-containing protein [Enterobacter quasihormaechei]|uniref:DUF4087 domain-containing protein n=1 Tax=Enterobacter quasihormaechei TaxID=2529382 RepID=UPI003A0FB92F